MAEASNEVGAFEPNYEGSPAVAGPAGGVSGAVGRHSFAARAGHHLAPQRLDSGADIYDWLGADFTLVALGARDADIEEPHCVLRDVELETKYLKGKNFHRSFVDPDLGAYDYRS